MCISGQFNRISQRIFIAPAPVTPDTTSTTATTTSVTKGKTNNATTQVSEYIIVKISYGSADSRSRLFYAS